MRKVKNYAGAATKKKYDPADHDSFWNFTPNDVGWLTGMAFVFGGVVIAEGIRYGRRVAATQRGEPVKPYNPWAPAD